MRLKMAFKFRIGTKILIALLGLSLISLILFAYIAVNSMMTLGRYALENNDSLGEQAVGDSEKALRAQAEEYLLRTAENQAALSNTLLKNVEDGVNIMASFAANLWLNPPPRFRHAYLQDEEPADIYSVSAYALAPGVNIDAVRNELELSGKLDEIFIPVFSCDPNLDTICLGTPSGIFKEYPWREGRDPSYDPRKRSWYTKAVSEKGIVWTEPYVHATTKELIVTCSKAFYGLGGELAGVIEADVTLKVMNEDITSTQIGKEGYAFLLDKKGNVIARPGLTAEDTRWDEAYKTENLLRSDNAGLKRIAEEMLEGKSGIGRIDFRGEEKYIAYGPLVSTGWSLGITMPVREIVAPAMATKDKITAVMKNTGWYIDRQIKTTLRIISFLFILIVFFVCAIGYRLSKKITRPISDLSNGAKIVGGGDLDHQMKIETGDEIEELAGAFNNMTRDLKAYIKELTETTRAKEKIVSELKIAHDIQMGILPKVFPPFPERKEFDIYAALEPAREVGGDFYDFFFIDKDQLFISIGDVSGKGVPAALFMAMTKTLIRTIAKEMAKPDEVLEVVNRELSLDNERCIFITVFCALLNIKTGVLDYANGGHNPPLIIRADDKRVEFLNEGSSTAIGLNKKTVFNKKKLTLKAGDTIFMYTDGVTEAANKKNEFFSEERLMKVVSMHCADSIEMLVKDMIGSIKSFSEGAPQSDDITLMALRYFKE